MAVFEIKPASYKIAVESIAVDITAAILINGLPLYTVISNVPVNPGAFNDPMLITVLAPMLLTAAECLLNSILYDLKGLLGTLSKKIFQPFCDTRSLLPTVNINAGSRPDAIW